MSTIYYYTTESGNTGWADAASLPRDESYTAEAFNCAGRLVVTCISEAEKAQRDARQRQEEELRDQNARERDRNRLERAKSECEDAAELDGRRRSDARAARDAASEVHSSALDNAQGLRSQLRDEIIAADVAIESADAIQDGVDFVTLVLFPKRIIWKIGVYGVGVVNDLSRPEYGIAEGATNVLGGTNLAASEARMPIRIAGDVVERAMSVRSALSSVPQFIIFDPVSASLEELRAFSEHLARADPTWFQEVLGVDIEKMKSITDQAIQAEEELQVADEAYARAYRRWEFSMFGGEWATCVNRKIAEMVLIEEPDLR